MPQRPQPQLSCHSPRRSRPQLENAMHRRAGQGRLSCRNPVAGSVGSQSSHWHGCHCFCPCGPAPSGHPLPSSGSIPVPGACQEALGHASLCPWGALAGQGDRPAPQTQAGRPNGRGWEKSYALEASAKARWECGRSNCVGICVAGMRIQGMHELTAPGDSRWCSSANLHNHH